MIVTTKRSDKYLLEEKANSKNKKKHKKTKKSKKSKNKVAYSSSESEDGIVFELFTTHYQRFLIFHWIFHIRT